ncbi:hypothetical protein [Selenomonas ruminantium]|uniref:Uncharacterized protein n=1 Tax=Selenomonas ruminantium TaxID=971 RepID=A0A1H0Q619_SELRU|nr:hypothetical protein [Selenomonas ruminantium]SDP12867.1 hypothetical protein SAMN05216366_10717 [Selenomonas ruminantium]
MDRMDAREAFERLYARVAAEGREEMLFGKETYEKAVKVLDKYAVANAGKGIFEFEFPFTGQPRMDLLAGYECRNLCAPVNFVGEVNPLIQNFFDAFAREPSFADYVYGYSFDLSAGASEDTMPGLYLLPPLGRPTEAYVPILLKTLGGEAFIPKVMNAFAEAPFRWQPHYAGYMAGRPGAPTRLGFSIKKADCLYYAEKREALLLDIETYMGREFSPEGRELLRFLAAGGWIYDLQFDLYPDGTLGDNLGVALSFDSNDVDPRKAAGFLERGAAGEKLRYLEHIGLADSRWRQMDRACYGVQHIVHSEGKRRLAGDVVKLDGIKVRFKKGNAYLAKGYLLAQSYYL